MMRCSRARIFVGLPLLLAALCFNACGGGDGNEDGQDGRPTEPATNNQAPQADAGSPSGAPASNVDVNLGSGALGGPPVPPEQPAWTAQEAASQVFSGLAYGDGTQQKPEYVSCTSDPASATGDGSRFRMFECYVEVAGVAPYNISLTVTEPDRAEFQFRAFAEPQSP